MTATQPDPRDTTCTLMRMGEDLAVIEQMLDLGQRDLARAACRKLLDGAGEAALTDLADLAAASERVRANTWMTRSWTKGYHRPHDWGMQPRTSPTPSSTRPITGQPRADGYALVEAYLVERGGLDDQPATVEAPPGYSLDYDLAAMRALHDTCLNCRLERPRAEQSHPDGLCAECTEGRTHPHLGDPHPLRRYRRGRRHQRHGAAAPGPGGEPTPATARSSPTGSTTTPRC